MSDYNLFIDFKLSKSKINSFIQKELDQIFSHKIQADGFQVQLMPLPQSSLELKASEKSVFALVPAKILFIKPEGLFSAEGEGSIKINLEINCNLDEDMQLTTKTTLLGHEWIEGPVLHVGQLNIPIETLSNCVIKYFNEELLEKLDNKIKSEVDVRKMVVDVLKEYGTNFIINKKPDLYFNAQLMQIRSELFREDDLNIYLNLSLEMATKISDLPLKFELEPNPAFYWRDSAKEKHNQKIDIELSFQGISKMVIAEINGKEFGGKTFDIESMHIRNTSLLEIKVNLREPIKGLLTITCTPFLDKINQKINLENIDIDIEAHNIIYKISSPIIERVIRSKIEAMLPFDPTPYLYQYVNKIPVVQFMENMISLKPHMDKVTVDALQFNNQNVVCTLMLEGAEVDITI